MNRLKKIIALSLSIVLSASTGSFVFAEKPKLKIEKKKPPFILNEKSTNRGSAEVFECANTLDEILRLRSSDIGEIYFYILQKDPFEKVSFVEKLLKSSWDFDTCLQRLDENLCFGVCREATPPAVWNMFKCFFEFVRKRVNSMTYKEREHASGCIAEMCSHGEKNPHSFMRILQYLGVVKSDFQQNLFKTKQRWEKRSGKANQLGEVKTQKNLIYKHRTLLSKLADHNASEGNPEKLQTPFGKLEIEADCYVKDEKGSESDYSTMCENLDEFIVTNKELGLRLINIIFDYLTISDSAEVQNFEQVCTTKEFKDLMAHEDTIELVSELQKKPEWINSANLLCGILFSAESNNKRNPTGGKWERAALRLVQELVEKSTSKEKSFFSEVFGNQNPYLPSYNNDDNCQAYDGGMKMGQYFIDPSSSTKYCRGFHPSVIDELNGYISEGSDLEMEEYEKFEEIREKEKEKNESEIKEKEKEEARGTPDVTASKREREEITESLTDLPSNKKIK